MSLESRKLPLALLLLRLSVFLVMLMWTIDKFLNPDHAAAVFDRFYFISGLDTVAFYIIGAIQLAIVVGFVIGFQKKITYLLVLVMHAISTFSTFEAYFNPYDKGNLLFFAAWPMLAACFTLYYLRDWDTKWTIDPTTR